jgi:hypothetical protein
VIVLWFGPNSLSSEAITIVDSSLPRIGWASWSRPAYEIVAESSVSHSS